MTAHHWTRPLSIWTPRAILAGLFVAGLGRLQLPALREGALVGAGLLLWGAIGDLADSRGYRLRGPSATRVTRSRPGSKRGSSFVWATRRIGPAPP
jgi:hypothetical protein